MKTGVLDFGFVEYVDHMGSDLTVVNSARVSFDNESEWEYDDRAISKVKTDTSSTASTFPLSMSVILWY